MDAGPRDDRDDDDDDDADDDGHAPPRRWRPAWRTLGRAALDLVLPPQCAACGARVQDPVALCASCWSTLHFIARPFCERTATPFTLDPGPGVVAPEAIQHPPRFGRARAAVLYKGQAPHLVHRLKYGDRHEVAVLLGGLMARAGADVLRDADMIVPVPLHRGRLWMRRFNQSALLGRVVSRATGVPMHTGLLARQRATAQQVGLSRTARARNVAGAFAVPERMRARVDGASVVLIDDVFTSGATLSAAARVLLRAGAARVDVLVFARVAEVIAVA